jgi:putative ABC transport system substrate-binding protein
MIKRRKFIAGLGSAAAWPMVARAQLAMPVVGWLSAVPGTIERALPSFAQGLAETGYVIGRNVTIEPREGGLDQLPARAADLVRRHVTVIVATGLRPALAAKAATQTIPVVFAMAADPVEFGVVASLNRPSGNLTGVGSYFGGGMAGKRFELLHKLVPAADPIAMLARTTSLSQIETRAMQAAARVLGVHLLALVADTETEAAAAFATLVEQHAGAMVTSSSGFPSAVYDQIISLADRHAVPTLFSTRALAARGGLASYGAKQSETARQAGLYVGRILKGDKPSDLPVEQPTKFEFVINLKTAKALGLTIPETLLATADEVIQ